MAVAGLVTVALTGAESTGKTTLAAALADHFNTEWVAEYLRIFVDQNGEVPKEQDVYAIAGGHLQLKAYHIRRARRVIILDTDLVTTCVYQRRFFGHCPALIEQLAQTHRADLYLLTQPDFPWKPDGIQRSGPKERSLVHRLLRLELEQLKLPFVRVSGSRDERRATGIEAVRSLLKSGRTRRPA